MEARFLMARNDDEGLRHPRPQPADRLVEKWLRSHAWDETFDQAAIEEEIQRIERKGWVIGKADMPRAIAFWRALRARRYPHTLLRSSVQITHVETFRPDDPGTPDA